jgi:hypothetical protein
MMWSQWRWDMKTWKVFAFAGPCVARTWLPKARTPLPRSQRTYSSPPTSICTQDELPPKVYGVENSCST